MTESQWPPSHFTSEDIAGFMTNASTRKRLLFECKLCRLMWRLLDKQVRRAVRQIEEIAESAKTDDSISELIPAEVLRIGSASLRANNFNNTVQYLIRSMQSAQSHEFRIFVDSIVSHISYNGDEKFIRGSTPIFGLVCELIGPKQGAMPFPDWLTWNDGTVRKLAQTIYDDSRFDLLPILADALEESGCDNADILTHCRGPGPHVRGCWVVDLLLGKE